jgi:hypothetical protein
VKCQKSAIDISFVKPWLDAFPDQPLRDLTDGRPVLTVVAQEDVRDFGIGISFAHADAEPGGNIHY